MQPDNLTPSYTLQHQDPLSKKEIEQLTQLFNELVESDRELMEIEKERGADRAARIAQETSEAFDHLIVDNEMNSDALEVIGALQHQEKCSALDKKFNAARQKFLNQMFQATAYLRSMNEYVAWECDLSAVISAMEKLNQWLQGIIQLTQDETIKQQSMHLQEEIEQHRDPSSELFLRTAEGIAIKQKEHENALQIDQETAIKCVQAYEGFRKVLGELSKSTQVFPEGYKSFTLSLKAFGLAFKNYKTVSASFTAAQCLQIFAPVGEQVPVQIPPIEF